MKLHSLLSFTGPASVVDPCAGQGAALRLVTGKAPVRRYSVELDAERANIAGSKGIETIQGNTFHTIARPESFSLLYLNPPYDSEIGTIANRRMEAVFLEHTYRWLRMEGVLVLVIPFERCLAKFHPGREMAAILELKAVLQGVFDWVEIFFDHAE